MLWNYCLYNGVIKILSLFIQVSPDHCSCGSASSDSCVTIPNLSFLDLTEDNFPSTCTPEAYISTNLVEEFQTVMIKFLLSPVHRDFHSEALTSCQQWKDDYLLSSSSSMAGSVLSCWTGYSQQAKTLLYNNYYWNSQPNLSPVISGNSFIHRL